MWDNFLLKLTFEISKRKNIIKITLDSIVNTYRIELPVLPLP